MKTEIAESRQSVGQRKESRLASVEPVTIVVAGPILYEIPGTVIDVSSSGFRVRHESRELLTGDRVHFRYGTKSGSAIVVWTRVAGAMIEAGFQIF